MAGNPPRGRSRGRASRRRATARDVLAPPGRRTHPGVRTSADGCRLIPGSRHPAAHVPGPTPTKELLAMYDYPNLFVGGQWVPSTGSARITVHSPHSLDLVGSVPDATGDDVDRAVTAARTAFD